MSVVIATRGRPLQLAAALRGVGRQSRPPVEVVVVNDGGRTADTSPSVLAPLAPRSRIRVIALDPGVGQVAARIAGASAAMGSHIAVLDDDDVWLEDHLAGLAQALADGAHLAYSDAELLTIDRTASPPALLERALFALRFDPAFARRYNPVIPSGMAYARSLHDRVGPFRLAAGHHWDWDFVLRVLDAGARVRRVPRATLLYTIDQAGTNESSKIGDMRHSASRLAEAHALGETQAHTFRTMLDETDVAAQAAPMSERPWDGDAGILAPMP